MALYGLSNDAGAGETAKSASDVPPVRDGTLGRNAGQRRIEIVKITICLGVLSALILASGTDGRGHSPGAPAVGSPIFGQEIALAESTVDQLRSRQPIVMVGDARTDQHTA